MPTQDTRPIGVTTPLGKDKLILRRALANEMLGGLFEVELDLISEDAEISMDDLVGQNVTVRLDLPENKTRFFNGFVCQFSQGGSEGSFSCYRAIVRPWLWFLTKKTDCRIFQNLKVPDIIKQIFEDQQGFAPEFEMQLSGKYRTWEYCVQYRETDFNFVSRLMEQEGIYYYFEHDDGQHKLVLADSPRAHKALPGLEEIPYYPPAESKIREQDHIYDWFVSQEVQSGVYALNDFDFKRPRADNNVRSSIQREHALANLEIYDYPGEFVTSGEGENYSRVRVEEQQAQHKRITGAGTTRGLSVGALFKLVDHPRQDQNQQYLVVSAAHELNSDDYGPSSGAASPQVYSGSYSVIGGKEPFRSARVTPKPVVAGPQTAMVVGPKGDEIYSDQFGRVKVQFHWDRRGGVDENSSCWVRVSHPWAGKGWGAIHIPRIGQEVVVDFLEGDPDRPIITGRVYNAVSKVPYELPANQTRSCVKSNSSKGGGGYNEYRFEDKKDEEEIFVHAQKDQNIVVENDETTSVGHDRSETVGNDETISIGHDRTESVKNDERISIGVNRSEDVGENETISIGSSRSESVGKDETVSVGANRSLDVGKDETISVGANRSDSVGKDETISVGKSRTQSVGKDDALDVGKKLVQVAGDEIILKTGQASIVMKKNGQIVISGKDIKIQGSGKIELKASGALTMKGSQIKQN